MWKESTYDWIPINTDRSVLWSVGDMLAVSLTKLLSCQWFETSQRWCDIVVTLQWRQNERDGITNHQPYGCLLNRLFGRRSKKTSKLRVTGLCEWNSSVTGEFPAQMASNPANVSIWWRHHEYLAVTMPRPLCTWTVTTTYSLCRPPSMP